MNSKRIRLWDLPTRLFHWLLALGVAAALITGQLGGNLIDWHGRIGIGIAGLIVFRLVWGLVGSTYARFSQFMPTPASIQAYLAGQWRGEGHNPLGALAVLGLLAVLLVQVVTGLFGNDDIAFVGPLFNVVSKDLSDRLTGVHHLISNIVIALVGLHIAAIVFYARARKRNLVKPMLTGWKDNGEGESARGGSLIALIVALLIAAAAIYGASGVWLPKATAPAAAEAPKW